MWPRGEGGGAAGVSADLCRTPEQARLHDRFL